MCEDLDCVHSLFFCLAQPPNFSRKKNSQKKRKMKTNSVNKFFLLHPGKDRGGRERKKYNHTSREKKKVERHWIMEIKKKKKKKKKKLQLIVICFLCVWAFFLNSTNFWSLISFFFVVLFFLFLPVWIETSRHWIANNVAKLQFASFFLTF